MVVQYLDLQGKLEAVLTETWLFMIRWDRFSGHERARLKRTRILQSYRINLHSPNSSRRLQISKACASGALWRKTRIAALASHSVLWPHNCSHWCQCVSSVRSLHFSSPQRGWRCKSATSLWGFTGAPKCARPLQSPVRSFSRYSTAVASELHASVFFFSFFLSLENVPADNTDACGAVKMSVCSRFKSLPAGRMDMLFGCQSPGC